MPPVFVIATGAAGNAAEDVEDARVQARCVGDTAGAAAVHDLFFDTIYGFLAEQSEAWLERHTRAWKPWRTDGRGTEVFRTPDLPSAAFAPLRIDGRYTLLFLGLCYRFPGTEDDWWKSVIEPRLALYS